MREANSLKRGQGEKHRRPEQTDSICIPYDKYRRRRIVAQFEWLLRFFNSYLVLLVLTRTQKVLLVCTTVPSSVVC